MFPAWSLWTTYGIKALVDITGHTIAAVLWASSNGKCPFQNIPQNETWHSRCGPNVPNTPGWLFLFLYDWTSGNAAKIAIEFWPPYPDSVASYLALSQTHWGFFTGEPLLSSVPFYMHVHFFFNPSAGCTQRQSLNHCSLITHCVLAALHSNYWRLPGSQEGAVLRPVGGTVSLRGMPQPPYWWWRNPNSHLGLEPRALKHCIY